MLKGIKGDNFYKAENKLSYLEFLGEIKDVYFVNSVFGHSKMLEEQKGEDICCFVKDDILSYYTSLMSCSADRLNNINSFLKLYTDWSISEHLVPKNKRQNHFLEIEYENLVECVNKTAIRNSLFTREVLESWAEYEILNLTNVACILLLFEGVRGNHYEELLDAQFKSVDSKEKKIVLATRELKLSDVCISVVKKAQKEFNYTLKSGREIPYCDDKMIYRSYRKDQLKTEKPNYRVFNLNKRLTDTIDEQFGMKCTLNNIFVSGQIDFVKRICKEEGKKVSEYILTRECYERVYERFRVATWRGKRFYENYQEMLEE